jgi:hypothetical protein
MSPFTLISFRLCGVLCCISGQFFTGVVIEREAPIFENGSLFDVYQL